MYRSLILGSLGLGSRAVMLCRCGGRSTAKTISAVVQGATCQTALFQVTFKHTADVRQNGSKEMLLSANASMVKLLRQGET